jgi:hypothetical protein
MGKRSPDDILGDIEASGAEEAADRALAMTADARAAELEAAGVTPAETAAAGDAWHERMQRTASDEARRRAEVEAREAAVGPRRRPAWPVLLAAALAFAAVVALYLASRGGLEAPVAQPTATPTSTSRPGTPSKADAGSDASGAADAADAAPDLAPPWNPKPRLK